MANEVNITLGMRLRQLREEEGRTQEEQAKLLLVTRQTISNWENGKRLPDIYMLKRIADLYRIGLDELYGNIEPEKEIRMGKEPAYLFLASIAVTIFYIIVGALTDHMYVGIAIMMAIIALPCQGFLHIVFKGAVNDDNFGIIAGYDSKIDYNMVEVKKMIKQVNIHVACISTTVVVLLFLSAYTENLNIFFRTEDLNGGTPLSMWLCIYYCVDLTASIMIHNFKSHNRIFQHESDARIARADRISVIWYVVLIFAACGTAIFRSEIKHMVNNSPDALQWMGWFFLFIIITTAGLFYEQHRAKKFANSKRGYHTGMLFWISTIIAVILLMIMSGVITVQP